MKNKVFIILVLLLVILAGAYFIWNKKGAPSQPLEIKEEQIVEQAAEQEQKQYEESAGEKATNEATQNAPATGTEVKKEAPVVAPVAKNYTVDISNFTFVPGSITINKGDTITWVNKDSVPHNVVGGVLNSPILSKGQSFSYKFNNSGTINYICTIHPAMRGVVIVR